MTEWWKAQWLDSFGRCFHDRKAVGLKHHQANGQMCFTLVQSASFPVALSPIGKLLGLHIQYQRRAKVQTLSSPYANVFCPRLKCLLDPDVYE